MKKVPHILLVGDVCIDETITVELANRANPESIFAFLFNQLDKTSKYGMAGFVYECLDKLGFRVIFARPRDVSIKTRIVDSYNNNLVARIDNDVKCDPCQINLDDIEELLDGNSLEAVVISDYNKGYVTDETIKTILELFPDVPVFLDTKKPNLGDFGECIIKVNLQEAKRATIVPKHTIITLGDKGAMQAGITYKPLDIYPKDPCGAGDAFLAGLVYGAVVKGTTGIAEGIVYSGLSVTKVGTYAPSSEEFEAKLEEYNDSQTLKW